MVKPVALGFLLSSSRATVEEPKCKWAPKGAGSKSTFVAYLHLIVFYSSSRDIVEEA